jgi:hypothetical protein
MLHFAFFAEEVIKQNYTAAITFFILLFLFIWCFYIQFLAEWIAIKRPNSSHVIFHRNSYFTFLFDFLSDLSTLSKEMIAFQCSFHGSTKFYGDANIKLYC